jgi:hypothetical protein
MQFSLKSGYHLVEVCFREFERLHFCSPLSKLRAQDTGLLCSVRLGSLSGDIEHSELLTLLITRCNEIDPRLLQLTTKLI